MSIKVHIVETARAIKTGISALAALDRPLGGYTVRPGEEFRRHANHTLKRIRDLIPPDVMTHSTFSASQILKS